MVVGVCNCHVVLSLSGRMRVRELPLNVAHAPDLACHVIDETRYNDLVAPLIRNEELSPVDIDMLWLAKTRQ